MSMNFKSNKNINVSCAQSTAIAQSTTDVCFSLRSHEQFSVTVNCVDEGDAS